MIRARWSHIALTIAWAISAHATLLVAQVVKPPPKTPPVKAPVKAPVKPASKAPAKPVTVSPAPAPPNIVLLVVNDWGWQDLSVPLFRDTTDANRTFHTPAIERFAAEGVTFTNAYAAASVGSPTRATMLTGRSPAFMHLTGDVSDTLAANTTVDGMRNPAWNSRGVSNAASPRAYTGALLPTILHSAGYRAVHVGRSEWSAAGMGYDELIPSPPHAAEWPSTMRDALDKASASTASSTSPAPFFLHVEFDAIALSSDVDSARFVRAGEGGLDSAGAAYAARLGTIDSALAEVSAWLATHTLTDRTVVIITSDNGGDASAQRGGLRNMQNAPLTGGMGSAYEGGIRVPLMIRWPGVARTGRRDDTPVITDDLFPTFLRIARIPNMVAQLKDASGHDLASTIDHTVPLASDRPLVWHYPHVSARRGPGVEPYSAIRVAKWKLIYFYSGSRYELYDLSSDIGEQRNQVLKQPEIAARLAEQLRDALTTVSAQMPVDAAYGTPMMLPGRIIVPIPPQ